MLDAGKIRQILGNLVVYIVHRTPPGGRIGAHPALGAALGSNAPSAAERTRSGYGATPRAVLAGDGEGLGEGGTREPRLGMALVFGSWSCTEA